MVGRNWLRGIGISGALALVLLIAVACGEDATPTPTATSPAPTATTAAVPPTATTAAPAAPTATTRAPVAAPATPTAMPQPTATPVPAIVGKMGGVAPAHAFVAPNQKEMPHMNGIVTVSHSAGLYNSLTEINPEVDEFNVVRCDLCKTWSLADDGITYTFKLHEDAVWHDGEAVTAEDVVLSLELINEPTRLVGYDVLKEYAAGRRHDRNVLFLYYDSSKIIDDHTVQVKTKQPTPAFIQALSWDYFPMYPEHLLKQGKLPTYGNTSALIGSGPFKLKKYEKDILSETERNPNYFKDNRPYFDGIVHHVIKDKQRVLAAYKTRQVLFPDSVVNRLSPRDNLEIEKQLAGQATIHWTKGYPAAWGIVMNSEKSPFNDPNVRKAVNLAMHRQPIVHTMGGVNPIGTPLPHDFPWSYTLEEALQMPGFREDSPMVKSAVDIAEAKRLTVEAGAGPGTKVTLMCSTSAELCDLAQLLKEQFEDVLGWDISIDQVETKIASERRKSGDYQWSMASGGVLNYDPDGAAIFYRKGTGRYFTESNHVDADLERVWAGITTETDLTKRKALVLEASNLLLERGALHLVYYQVFAWIVDNSIQNFHLPPAFLTHMKHEHLWCDPAC